MRFTLIVTVCGLRLAEVRVFVGKLFVCSEEEAALALSRWVCYAIWSSYDQKSNLIQIQLTISFNNGDGTGFAVWVALTIPEMDYCKYYCWEIPATAAGSYCKCLFPQGRASYLTILQCFYVQGTKTKFPWKMAVETMMIFWQLHKMYRSSNLKGKGSLIPSLKSSISVGTLPSK